MSDRVACSSPIAPWMCAGGTLRGLMMAASGTAYPRRLPEQRSTQLICLSEIYLPPPAPPVFPDVDQVTQVARSFILRYLERLGGGPRLERPLDETVSMCAQLCPDGDSEGVFLATV